MPKRMTIFVPAVLVFLPALVLVAARASFAERATAECISNPGSTSPRGSHWYFRVDRVLHRQCWYLGPEGAKVHAGAGQVEQSMRLPLPRPVPPPIAGAADARAVTTPIMTSESDVDENSILRWPRVSPGTATSEAAFMSNGAQDDMPLIWPVLTAADVAAAGLQPASSAGPEGMLAMFAGAFAFVTVMARSFLKRSGALRAGRSIPLGRRRASTDLRGSSARMPPPVADRPAAASLADFMRNSNRATRQVHHRFSAAVAK